MSVGPVEYMVVAFPGNQFKGEIAPALRDLVETGTIHIIDLAFVHKDQDGNVTAVELENEGADVLGQFAGIVMDRDDDLINDDDLELIGEALDANSSAAVLVWEDVWATRLADAIADAGGQIIELQRIPRDVVQAAIEFNEAASSLA